MYLHCVKKTDLGVFLPGHNDSCTSKMKKWPRNGRKQPRRDVKVSKSESKSKRPEKKTFCIHVLMSKSERTEKSLLLSVIKCTHCVQPWDEQELSHNLRGEE